MATNGLVVMTPTTVAKTGASSTATINADGSVTFGSCETLSLNGVFTSSYDNYMIVCRNVGNTSDSLEMRWRASGTDDSGSNYTFQILRANGTAVEAERNTGQRTRFGVTSSTARSGQIAYVFGPHLSQPTAHRSVDMNGISSARMDDFASTHSVSSSYDGFTIFLGTAGNNFSGLITVFGFNQ